MRLLSALLIAVVAVSCNKESSRLDGKLRYFDIAGFIDKEARSLADKKIDVDKIVFLNDKEESKNLAIADWANELSAFKNCDINKRSFLGKYAVDSLYDGSIRKVKYTAMDKKLRTRALSIDYSGNDPVKIQASVATDNILYSSRQELVYEPGKGYHISGKQSVKFLEPDTFYIQAQFLNQ